MLFLSVVLLCMQCSRFRSPGKPDGVGTAKVFTVETFVGVKGMEKQTVNDEQNLQVRRRKKA